MEIAMEISVDITTKETIKPSSPTPFHLQNFKLCLLDQLAPVSYGPLVLFYSVHGIATHHHPSVPERSRRLKASLSETLTRFYPLAGRVKEDDWIECNDLGAVFVEARVDCLLSRFLEKPDAQVIGKLIPVEVESPEARTGSLVQVQASFFACGGLAIGVCISHKIADPNTFSTFVKSWAATSLGFGETVQPLCNASAIFPPQKFSFRKPAANNLKKDKCVCQRFVFDGPKIGQLKAKAASETVRQPTRVEAVTALIWKCAMNAARSNSELSRFSILSQSVNIRPRMVPPLPEHTIGNLVGHFASYATECEIELQSVVSQLRIGLQEFGDNYVKKLQGDGAFRAICESFEEARYLLREGSIDFYISTSLCRFPFYGIDFGWGKPCWVSIPSGDYKNFVAMMDSRDGDGIEAWVTLSEDDMTFFQRDQELLAVATVNPTASNHKYSSL